MKTNLILLMSVLIFTSVVKANVINYSASNKLNESSELHWSDNTIYTDAFNVSIQSHTFSDGHGTITFNGELTSIGYCAFFCCTSLTSITLPNSLTSIGQSAFDGCTGITSVSIPNSVTDIGPYAFRRVRNIVYSGPTSLIGTAGALCVNGYVDGDLVYEDATKQVLKGCSSAAQGEINIPSSVTSIGYMAFGGCTGLTFITIPNNVTTIGDGAFSSCTSLTYITIPYSVTSIGDGAFFGCTGITSITWNAKNCNGYNFGDQVEKFTFGDSVQSIPCEICRNMSKLTSITIPNSVTSIEGSAFFGCSSLSSVTIGNSVTSIAYSAFYDCNNITSVIWNAKNCNGCNFGNQVEQFTFGDSVQVIPNDLCGGMSKLTSINIPNSVTSIAMWAFSGCTGLTAVHINDLASWCAIKFYDYRSNPLYYAEHLYMNGKEVTELNIPQGVTSISNYAFQNCTGLTSVTIPNGVTSISNYAFQNCTGLTSVTIPNGVTSIGNFAFFHCTGLTSITLPNSVTSIGNSTFSDCNRLTKIDLGTNVASIGDYAFQDCGSIDTLTIPNSITKIGVSAFNGCIGLTAVTMGENLDTICESAFEGCSGINTMTVKAATPPTCQKNCFRDINRSIPLYVPSASIDLYKAAVIWREFTNIKGINEEEGFEDLQSIKDESSDNKVFIDGHLYILRDGKTYTTQGAEVK